MVLIKKNKLLNELIFIGFLIYLAILTTQSLRISNNLNFLPNKVTIFEILKTYFFAITILIVIEYFIAFDLPNNYLVSRIFGVFVMCTFTVVAFNLFNKTWVFQNQIAINIIYFTSIIYGSFASYYIQKIKLNQSLILGITYYSLFAMSFIILTIISPVGYIFE